jgi:enoyl-CoA hydratase
VPETSLTVRRGRGWALVSLASGRGLNRLGTSALHALTDLVSGLLAEKELACLGITGEGGSFAVGADLNEILALKPHTAREFSELGNGLFRMMERSGKVTVAAINGFCLGGGLDLALSADWRLATPGSLFGHPGADLGLITGFGGTQRLPRLVGMKRSLDVLFSGARIDGRKAYQLGLVQELCSPEELREQLTSRLKHFAAMPDGMAGELKSGLRRLAG